MKNRKQSLAFAIKQRNLNAIAVKSKLLEAEYDKLDHYDEELDKKLEHAKEMEEFYSELGRKLKEVL